MDALRAKAPGGHPLRTAFGLAAARLTISALPRFVRMWFHPTQEREFWKIFIHGESSPHSGGW
jgi:hypothetical protein